MQCDLRFEDQSEAAGSSRARPPRVEYLKQIIHVHDTVVVDVAGATRRAVRFAAESVIAHVRLGSTHQRLGWYEQAHSHLEQSVEIAAGLVEQVPENIDFVRSLATAHGSLGHLYADLTQAADDGGSEHRRLARQYLTRALEQIEHMRTLGPLEPRDETQRDQMMELLAQVDARE